MNDTEQRTNVGSDNLSDEDRKDMDADLLAFIEATDGDCRQGPERKEQTVGDFVFNNHRRLLFLTADIEDPNVRKARNELLDRMAVMTYSATCLQIDEILNEHGLSLNPLGADVARPRSISDEIMDLVDRLGHEWKDVDPRAWSRLLIYAPAQSGEPVAWFYYEDDEFIRMYDSEDKAAAACEKFGGHWQPVYLHAAPQSSQPVEAGEALTDDPCQWREEEGNFGDRIVRCRTCGVHRGNPCPKSAAPSAVVLDDGRAAFQFSEFEEAEWNVALENMDTRTPEGVKRFAIWAIENRTASAQPAVPASSAGAQS